MSVMIGARRSTDSQLNLVTDFASKLHDWNTFQNTDSQSHTLIIPSGSFNAQLGGNGLLARYGPGVQTILGQGESVTLVDNLNDAFNHGFYVTASEGNENGPLPKIDTILIGESVCTLKSLADVSQFSVGQWVLVVAYDMQGYGYPQNNHFFEYRQITAIDTGTGEITLDQGVRHDYKDTFPHLANGTPFQPDQCGAATLIPLLEHGWNARYHARNMTLNPTATNAFYGAAKEIIYEHCTFPHYGPIPTTQREIIYRYCTFNGSSGFEFDKFVETVRMENVNSVDPTTIQSSSIYELIVSDSAIGSIVGTPKRTTMTNVTLGFLRMGPSAYGGGYSVELDNVVCNQLSPNNSSFLYAPLTHIGSGVFTITKASADANNVLIRFIPDPGVWYCLKDITGSRIGPVFQCTDVSWDSGSTVITYTTTLTGSEPQLAIAYEMCIIDAPHLIVRNTTTGALAFISEDADEGRSSGEYYNSGAWDPANYFYLGSGPTPRVAGFRETPQGWLGGNVVSITFTVTKAYTGVHNPLTIAMFNGEFFGTPMTKADGTQGTWSGPYFDLRVAGTRVITPSGTTGSVGNDSINMSPFVWLDSRNRVFLRVSNDISGESSSVWPEFEMEIILDQGIP